MDYKKKLHISKLRRKVQVLTPADRTLSIAIFHSAFYHLAGFSPILKRILYRSDRVQCLKLILDEENLSKSFKVSQEF